MTFSVITTGTGPEPHQANATEMTGLPLLWSRVRALWQWHVWRRVPYLVWHDQQVDVTITFSTSTLGNFNDDLHQAETHIRNMGIVFDKGVGHDGRDWEWDWSLQGPVSVRFRGRASKPERRQRPSRPTLAVSNPPAA